jgi:hypothetical protein
VGHGQGFLTSAGDVPQAGDCQKGEGDYAVSMTSLQCCVARVSSAAAFEQDGTRLVLVSLDNFAVS